MIAASAPIFQIRRLSADGVGGLADLLPGGASDAANSVWPFKAARRLIPVGLHSAFAVCQDVARQRANPIRSFSSVLFHASKETHGACEWNEKVLPNPPKVLVKLK